MGIVISKVFNSFRENWNQKVHIGIIGLDAAGKTTLIYRLKNLLRVEELNPIPMDSSLSCHKYIFKDTTLIELDLYERLFTSYIKEFSEVEGLIFVLDSKDKERHEFAKEELHRFLEKNIQKKLPLLVLANKFDLCTEKNEDYDFTQILSLNNLNNVSEWHLQKSSALYKEGIIEGYRWILSKINQNNSQ